MSVLLQTYKDMLDFAGITTNSEGYTYLKGSDGKDMVTINTQRLVLPCKEQLASPSNKIFFHPMKEDYRGTESPVLKKLKTSINIQLNKVAITVFQSLLNIVANPELHKQLTPEQNYLLMNVKSETDEKTVINSTEYIAGSLKKEQGDKFFVSIFLNRSGKFKGKSVGKIAVVSWPFYNKIEAKEITKFRAKDNKVYIEVLKFMFPDISEYDAYTVATDGLVAPLLVTLMQSSGNIAARLNELLGVYKEFIPFDDLAFNLEWLEHFDNVEALLPEIRMIPSLPGNEGLLELPSQTAAAQQPAPPPPQPQSQQYQPQPSYLPPPAYPQQPQPSYYPQQPQQQYGYMPPPPPQPLMTERGMSYRSMVAANPNLGRAAVAPQPQYMQPQQERVPNWAIPTNPIPPQQAYGSPQAFNNYSTVMV